MSKLFLTGIELDLEGHDDTHYPFNLPAVKHIGRFRFNKPVTFLVGENGTEKSTILEAIAVKYGFNAEGGSRNFNFSTETTHSELYKFITLTRGVSRPADGFFLRAESFYNVATEIDKLDEEYPYPLLESYGGKSLHGQSHGESFISLVQNRFFGNGLYILDEPEAALSPVRQMSLLVYIHELVKLNSQFIISTHSPILLSYPNADIYELTENDIRLTHYKDTEHYVLTKQFLNNPEGMLKYLLD